MGKFNVGDRVRIVGVIGKYNRYNGQLGTVSKFTTESSVWPYNVALDNYTSSLYGQSFDESELELVVENSTDDTVDKLFDEAVARKNDLDAAEAALTAAKAAFKDATMKWMEANK